MMHGCSNTSSVPQDNLLWLELAWPRTQQSEWSTKILLDMILFSIWVIFCHSLSLCSSRVCLANLLSGILSCISSGPLSANLCGISSGILSGISSGTLTGICSGISSGILSGISSDILSGILSGKSSGILSGISSGILSGRWGPAALTELGRSQMLTQLGRSQVEVQRCPLRSDPCSWGPAVPTVCGSWRRAWRRVGKAEVDMEVAEIEVVEEKEEKEEKEKEKKENNSDKS